MLAFFLTLIIPLLISQPVTQKLPSPKKCNKSFKKVIRKLESRNQWKRVVDRDQGVLTLRSPTKKFGKWVQVEYRPKKELAQVRVYDPFGESVYKVSSTKKCKYNSRSTKKYSKRLINKSYVTDQKLKKVIRKGQGVIYIWSPAMEYSMVFQKKFKEYARKDGILFQSFAEERAKIKAIKKASRVFEISKKDTRRIASTEMDMRDYRLHYPVVYVYRNGKIHPKKIAGVVDELEFSLKVKGRLNDLK